MTTVDVVIPYREDSPRRAENADAVTLHLHAILPEAHITRWDSGHDPFSLAASRNLGVRHATAEVVVVCDCDCLVEPGPLTEAIEAAVQDGRVHYPFNTTEWIDMDGQITGSGGIANGGVMVCTPDTWWSVGGQDEGFVGWGGEDDAFRLACDRLAGGVVHHDGVMRLLMHPRLEGAWNGFANPHYRANLERLRVWQDADLETTRHMARLA